MSPVVSKVAKIDASSEGTCLSKSPVFFMRAHFWETDPESLYAGQVFCVAALDALHARLILRGNISETDLQIFLARFIFVSLSSKVGWNLQFI